MAGDVLQGFRAQKSSAHAAVSRHRTQEASPTGAPEPCSLGNTEQPAGSKESRGEPQSSYPCRQLLNPYDLGNDLQVFSWEDGKGDDGNTHTPG